MAFSDAWDETSPNGAVVAANTLDTIIKNEVKRAVRERLESIFGIADFDTRDPMSADAFNMGGAADSYIIGGTASWGIKNNAGTNYNIQITNAGVMTVRAGLTVTAGGATITAGDVTVTAGNLTMTVGKITTPDLDVSSQARLIEYDAGNFTGAKTVDFENGNNQKFILTGNSTLTFSNPVTGCWYQLRVVQDGTGSRTITWPATVKWLNAVTPTLTTTASRTDMFAFYYNGTNYLGTIVGLNWNG